MKIYVTFNIHTYLLDVVNPVLLTMGWSKYTPLPRASHVPVNHVPIDFKSPCGILIMSTGAKYHYLAPVDIIMNGKGMLDLAKYRVEMC